jgi:hypothetical protein
VIFALVGNIKQFFSPCDANNDRYCIEIKDYRYYKGSSNPILRLKEMEVEVIHGFHNDLGL